MPNGGYVKENGISVCEDHHLLCEQFHIEGKVDDPKYHPNNLYHMVGSHFLTAVKASERLKV